MVFVSLKGFVEQASVTPFGRFNIIVSPSSVKEGFHVFVTDRSSAEGLRWTIERTFEEMKKLRQSLKTIVFCKNRPCCRPFYQSLKLSPFPGSPRSTHMTKRCRHASKMQVFLRDLLSSYETQEQMHCENSKRAHKMLDEFLDVSSQHARHANRLVDQSTSLRVVLDASTTSGDCSICLHHFMTSKIVEITPCGHAFHHGCLLQWLITGRHCPICRQSVTL